MMFTKLQRNLIIASTVALLLIFVVMIGAINAVSFYTTQRQVSQSLEILAGNQMADGDFLRIRENLPNVTASSLYQISDYCIIRLTRSGALYEWKSENRQLYDDGVVEQLLQEIKDTEKRQGRIGSKVFRIEAGERGDRIAVIDIQAELNHASNLLKITIMVGALFWCILSVLASALILRLMRPVSEAFSKQQKFVWDASHELKTPLAVISANAQVLAIEIGRNENLDYILQEIARTNTLVQNLLSLARMDANRTQGDTQRFDLGKTLLQAMLPMESLVFEQGKTLHLQVPDGIAYTGNPELLKELAVILLSNAIQYSGSGSEITVSLCEQGIHPVLTVHNTGSYIDEETQKHIFERFYRGETSHNRDTGGTGLGLAIAKSIVEYHRGHICVKSAPHSGTTFFVNL